MTWTGKCSGSVAQGEGTLTNNAMGITEATGHLQNGRKYGQWVERFQRGAARQISEGPYVHGTKHGQWVERRDDWVSKGVLCERQKAWTMGYRRAMGSKKTPMQTAYITAPTSRAGRADLRKKDLMSMARCTGDGSGVTRMERYATNRPM